MRGEKEGAGGGRDGSADWEAAGGAVGVSAGLVRLGTGFVGLRADRRATASC